MQGTTHIFKLSLPGKAENMPPHLAAAAIPQIERRDFKAVKLAAVGRARGGTALNGAIPGSAAASAAVKLYTGNAGRLVQLNASRRLATEIGHEQLPICTKHSSSG